MKINTTSISINILLVSVWSALIILPPVQNKEFKGENVGDTVGNTEFFHVPYSAAAAQSTMRYVVFSEGNNSAS